MGWICPPQPNVLLLPCPVALLILSQRTYGILVGGDGSCSQIHQESVGLEGGSWILQAKSSCQLQLQDTG